MLRVPAAALSAALSLSLFVPSQHPSFTPLPENHLGRIPVLEYHVIGGVKDSDYTRTAAHFRNDLELVYSRGYRPITISQMLDKDFSDVPPGMSPVVVTFDDASPSQFRYIEHNGQLEIDPESAVGIWMDFAKTHPDWKGKAVFCMLNGGNAGHNFFGYTGVQGQKTAWRFPKVKWLADNGFELCDHTLWHAQLNKYSDDTVQAQIAHNILGIDSAVAGYKVRTFALPYGVWPKDSVLAFAGSWKNTKNGMVVKYAFDAVLEVDGGPTRSPYDPKFESPKYPGHKITRMQMNGNVLAHTLDQLDRPSPTDKTRMRFVQ